MRCLIVGFLLCACLGLPRAAAADAVTVFAAASMTEALSEIADGYTAATGQSLRLSFAGSSALARQIEQGAPADIFVSANAAWMDHLEARGHVVPGSRFDLTSNGLVLIAHGATAPETEIQITPTLDLSGLLAGGRLAMALTEAVPAGIYGRAALAHLGRWDEVAGQVAETDNVRAALMLVASGAAPLGIVYHSDAMAEPRVRILGVFPEDSHPPITYPVALMDGGDAPAARAFLSYLQASPAAAILAAHGFRAPGG
ncbi:Molybdenum ABC transporter, periplasmic molybdenum-binding protein ModA [Roseibacterium elongatum DSM 19469]|uniref:Molybdate-binding protein ModA n=1 Tax=Roseicyclus elongatus DSM 19469 TaxID=1294273 RepID=W8SQ45_9RHOB|nr:molybdate ABC transporter substrate-binding protein [Roseibacterium elongatum]AHM04670.1 Molybdenum ABC transporter, periplasmic molybdenum-binding protein ModA [Roseibacterium elongatum DSM 19469]